mgnify:CR=1 FL=1
MVSEHDIICQIIKFNAGSDKNEYLSDGHFKLSLWLLMRSDRSLNPADTSLMTSDCLLKRSEWGLKRSEWSLNLSEESLKPSEQSYKRSDTFLENGKGLQNQLLPPNPAFGKLRASPRGLKKKDHLS